MKTIALKQIGWKITGKAVVLLWGGCEATVNMDSVRLYFTTPPTSEQLIEHINDGGFDVEKILGASVDIHTLYEQGFYEYSETIIVNTNNGISDEKLCNILNSIPQRCEYTSVIIRNCLISKS